MHAGKVKRFEGKTAFPSRISSVFTSIIRKEAVKVVCIDLSGTYPHLIQSYFPNAKIIVDRFHVGRLMLHQCMHTYQDIDLKIKNNRGLLAALRTKPKNLTTKRLQKRNDYLKQQPIINAIYQFKQQ